MRGLRTLLRGSVRARLRKGVSFSLVHFGADLTVSETRGVLTDFGRQGGLNGYGLSLCASPSPRRCAALGLHSDLLTVSYSVLTNLSSRWVHVKQKQLGAALYSI